MVPVEMNQDPSVADEFSDVQAGFRKGRGTRDQFADICGIMEEAKHKNIYFCFTDYAKTFDLWTTTNCGNS